MQKRAGELFGRFQSGAAVPMSRDTLRELEGLSQRRPTTTADAASKGTKPLRKQIIQAIRGLPRRGALELLRELAASKHRSSPASDVDIGQYGGSLLAQCSIEELHSLLWRLRPDLAAERKRALRPVRVGETPRRAGAKSVTNLASARAQATPVAKQTSAPVRATPETKAMRRRMVAVLRDEMPRERALTILTNLAAVAKMPAPSSEADIGAFAGGLFARGFTTSELVVLAKGLGVPSGVWTKPRKQRASVTQKPPKRRGSGASQPKRRSAKQRKPTKSASVPVSQAPTKSRGRKKNAKAARKSRQKLIADLNAEPSKSDAMNYRVPGSFGSRRG